MRQRGKEIVREREADRCTLAREKIKGYSNSWEKCQRQNQRQTGKYTMAQRERHRQKERKREADRCILARKEIKGYSNRQREKVSETK